ncbi:porin [Herbaspirillum seropedicae]|uniref:porin n=1 Tax=Herbaspirillum seropedicae TaxID=964 RepID=UPI00111FDD32|nr:porin [Herbaspirillum seropedicae]QDD67123.1 porin [Herbaspirillum seropedicae]
MKKSSLLLLAAGLTSGGAAFAQSNVTIYGIVDTSVRYISNDNQQGQSNVRMDNGAIANSRIGFKGTEDLGGGLKAMFQLENGFSSDTGAMSSPGVLFNRQSWVGLAGNFGKVSLGRQNTPLFDLLADHFDPLTVGNYESNSWLPAAGSLIRTSNMIKYYGSFSGFNLGLSYAAGEKAGSTRTGSQISSSLQYTTGPFSVGGGWQQTVSALNSSYKHTTINLNASYKIGAVKLFGGYFNIKDDAGLTPTYISMPGSLAANAVDSNGVGGTLGIKRKDNGYFLGTSYQATSALSLTGAFYYDKSQNVSINGLGNVGDGRRYALVGWAEYALSKRTQLYTTIDYNKAKDAARYELPGQAAGKDNVTSVGVGIRHIF